MASTTQTGRLLKVTTPLGPDVLLAVGLTGREAISELFQFKLEARSERKKDVPFDKLIGQKVQVAIELPGKKFRYFSGICARISQGESDATFTSYSMEIVPQFWLLTKRTQSRIFQQKSVVDVLKAVLTGLDVEYKLQGQFPVREFCVQYRESDFAFASRLMEEEGIFYFFQHTESGDKLVVANAPSAHPPVPAGSATVTYKTGSREANDGDVIFSMMRTQSIASSKFTLWDHTFETPHRHHDVDKPIASSAEMGKVTHKLKSAELEVYDFPGGYAKPFDGIDKGGGERPAELNKIGDNGKRIVDLRAQQEAAASVAVSGTGSCRHFTTGHKFTVKTLPDDLATGPVKVDGEYVLTEVSHAARIGANLRSGENEPDMYDNTFTALPPSVPFRPARTTPKPVVPGCQSAVVVGPPGEEIYPDKYGRVKVQFHWDRQGKNDAGSSCWCRVAVGSAGRKWGMLAIPRVGQEVIVDFLEGDPDQPIIVGCVYNPEQEPAYKLPDEKTKSYWKSNSSPGGVGYNEIRFEDKKDKEQVYVHAQRDLDERVIHDTKEIVGHDRHLRVGFELKSTKSGDETSETKTGSQFEEVAVDKHLKVHRNRIEHVGGNFQLLVGGVDGPGDADVHIKHKKKELIDDTSELTVQKSRSTKVGGTDSLTVGGDLQEKVGKNFAAEAGQEIHLKAGMKVIIEAGVQLTLKGPGGFIDIGPTGVAIQGIMVLINSGGAAGSGSGCSPASPSTPVDANPKKPTDADKAKSGEKSCS